MTKNEEINSYESQWIFGNIEERKSELAVFEMQGQGDPVEMVKLLIDNGHLKTVMK